MVKRRVPSIAKPTNSQLEAFILAADGGSNDNHNKNLDKSAKRDFKGIRVPFNEYEYQKLSELAEKTGRTKLNVIRWAILQIAESLEQNKPEKQT